MIKHAGRVSIIVALRKWGPQIVRFKGDEDAGLYIHHFRNTFGTPLACRGTVAELKEFVEKYEDPIVVPREEGR